VHIPDGILPLPATLGGFLLAGGLLALSLARIRRLPDPRAAVPGAAMLTAAFFLASLIHFPLPPMSVHLVLNGLMGALLGWFAFPAIVVGLFLQAVMFGHGGLTTLGVNACLLGLPALLAFALLRAGHRLAGRHRARLLPLLAFIASSGAVVLSVLLLGGVVLGTLPLALDPAAEARAIWALGLAYTPVAVLEGALAASLVGFFLRTRPGMLDPLR
jgi:cobalt/nickel transport system permease protein